MVYYPDLLGAARSQVEQLDDLLTRGENLLNVRSHPGKTRAFVDWSTEVETFISHNCGHKSYTGSQFSALVFFPRWFDPKIHGPFQPGETARVLTDAHVNDAQAAFNIYKEDLEKGVAIIKSLIAQIKTSGTALKRHSEVVETEARTPISFSPHVTQINSQSQKQEQQQELTVDVAITHAVQQIKEKTNDRIADEAEQKLKNLQKNNSWDNAKSVLLWAANAGKDVAVAVMPVLLDFFLKRGMG